MTKAPRKVPTQARSRALVDALLDGVDALLETRELDELDVNDVAKQSGVSVGSLYQYFASKDALLAAWEERVLARIAERFFEFHLSVRARELPVREAARLHLEFGYDELARLARRYRELSRASDTLSRLQRRVSSSRTAAQVLAEMLRSRPAENFRVADLDTAAFVVVCSMTFGAFYGSLARPEAAADGRLKRELCDQAMRYLFPDEGS